MAKSLKALRNDYRSQGVFYTPQKLAEYMRSFLPEDVREVYDPTCGEGNLLRIFPESVRKFGQEIDPQAAGTASRLLNSEIVCGDTLQNPSFLARRFHAILANPPFSQKWQPPSDDVRFSSAPVLPPNSKADYAYLLHILYMLDDDGVAVVLSSPGIAYRGQREGKIRKWLIEQGYVHTVVSLSGGQFDDTQIAVLLLVLKKGKKAETVTFIEYGRDVQRQVPVDEIVDNDYSLSVNLYLPCADVEGGEPVDLVALEREARATLIQNVRASLEFSKTIQEQGLVEMELTSLLDELETVIESFR